MSTSEKPFTQKEINRIRDNHPNEHRKMKHMLTVLDLSIKETRQDAFQSDQHQADAARRYGTNDARYLEYARIASLHKETAVLSKAHHENLMNMISRFFTFLTEVYTIQENRKPGVMGREKQGISPVSFLQGAATIMRNMTYAQHEWSQKWLAISAKWDEDGAKEWMRKMQELYPGCFGAPKPAS